MGKIICHQVNCMGKMGTGLALKIKQKYPLAYKAYMDAYRKGELHLGNVIFAEINADLIIANLCGQKYYGRKGKYTSYEAIEKCLKAVNTFRSYSPFKDYEIWIPKKMGCASGGGRWSVVSNMVSQAIPDAKIVSYYDI